MVKGPSKGTKATAPKPAPTGNTGTRGTTGAGGKKIPTGNLGTFSEKPPKTE